MQETQPNPPFILDVGGEGRNSEAWNLNASRVKTFGPNKGQSIPRLILARGEQIPLADGTVDWIIIERTPLRTATLREAARVIAPHGRITLRHVLMPGSDRHLTAKQLLPGHVSTQVHRTGSQTVQQTEFYLTPHHAQ